MIFLQGFWKKDREIKNESYILINKSVFSKSKKLLHLKRKFNMKLLILTCLLFLFSCGENKPSGQNKEDTTIVKKAIKINGLVVQPIMLSAITFLNGDKIPFAKTNIDWKKAIALGQPAWCYADKLNEKGILYNYYAVCDKRGIQKDTYKLTPQKALKLLAVKELKWNKFFDVNDCAEKGLMGNVYNLNYLNLWIQDTLIQGQEMNSPCFIIDYKTNKTYIKNINKGNGFHLLEIN